MKKDNGYTLIEMLIAMLIILITSSLVIFAPKLDQIQLKSVVYSMASTLRLAREYNLEGGDHRFFLRSENGEFLYGLKVSSAYSNDNTKKVPKDIAISKRIAENDDEEVTGDFTILNPNSFGTYADIRFSSQGASGATTIRIEKAKLKVYYEISIVPTSGRVHIYKRYK